MQLIKVTYGHETFSQPGKTCRVQVFWRNSLQGKDFPLVDAIKNNVEGIKNYGARETIPACSLNKNHGQWTEAHYEMVDNSAMVISITRQFSGQGFPTRFQFLLLARPDAALRRISIPLTCHPKANKQEAYIEGKFDFIMPSEFEKLSVNVEPNFSHLFIDEEELKHEIDVTVLEKETKALSAPSMTRVTTGKGKVVLMTKSRIRKVNLK